MKLHTVFPPSLMAGGQIARPEEVVMPEPAGPNLDRRIARSLLGDNSPRVPPYSTSDAAADLLLWRLAQTGIAFQVQQFEGLHYCMLWSGSGGPGLVTASAESRPLSIGRAALDLAARLSGPGSRRPVPEWRAPTASS
jgi:hypothetical protein